MAEPVKRPSGLHVRGRRFWDEVTGTFELSGAELQLLEEAARCLDELDLLRKAMGEDGLTVAGSKGQTRVHPALESMRATRTVFGRLVAALQLPDEAGAVMPTGPQLRGQAAARARWDKARAPRGGA